MNPNPSALQTALPPVLDEEGEVVMRNSIKSPAVLAGVYQYLFTSDLPSSRARAKVQSQVDGDPPFSSDQDRLLGLGGRTNANWGYASQSQQDIERPYNDVFDSIAVFGTTPLKADYGSDLERQQYEPVIAEELSRMIRNWPKFQFNRQLCVHLFTMFGVAFTFREDEFDWRFKVTSLQHLKLPRRTDACIEDQDIIVCKVAMLPAELKKKIASPAAAEALGWNVKAVNDAIATAQPTPIDTSNPETLQEIVKDLDFFTGAGSVTVEVVHGWKKELDGSITHVIGRYDGVGEFLYKREGLYDDMSQLVTAYTDGVGSNGDFYSIRGNAWRGFNSSLYLNLLTCKAMDMACFTSTPLLQATNEDAIIDQMIRPRGPFNVIDDGVSLVEVNHVPFQQNIIPMLGQMRDIFSMRSRQAGGSGRYNAQKTKTAEEVKMDSAIDGQLTTAGMDLYFESWKNDFKEIVRRACNPALTAAMPGGKEAFNFRKRCAARGVPLEALKHVDFDAIEINKGVGKGSAQERRAAFSALMPNIGQYDPKGQQKLLWNFTAAYTDSAFANEMVPPDPGSRPPIDVQVANMENSLMLLGAKATIEPNQNHVVHVADHLSAMAEINGALGQQQIPFAEGIQKLGPLWRHASEHMAYISPKDPQFKAFKEALAEIEEVVLNGEKKLAAEARRAQEQGEQTGQPAPDGTGEAPLSVLRQSAEAGARLEMMKQQNQLSYLTAKNQMDLDSKAQEKAFKEAQYVLKLREQAAKQANSTPQ